MKNLVFCCFAYKESFSGSVNIPYGKVKPIEVYLKNAFVALKTTKLYNPATDVALAVNFKIPDFYGELYKRSGIAVYECDFTDFVFPQGFSWSLAFYKLNALKRLVAQTDYDNYIEIDSDVICLGSLDEVWRELGEALMMLSGPFSYNHPVRRSYSADAARLFGISGRLVKYGSGFIGGSRDDLTELAAECERIYNVIRDSGFACGSDTGDELITSIAALRFEVRDAKPYMDVYWTGKFYLASTNYFYDKMCFLHLPNEKDRGIVRLFDYYIAKNRFPDNKRLYKILGFPKARRPHFFAFAARVLLEKVRHSLKPFGKES